jgi:hypothetical protein
LEKRQQGRDAERLYTYASSVKTNDPFMPCVGRSLNIETSPERRQPHEQCLRVFSPSLAGAYTCFKVVRQSVEPQVVPHKHLHE